MYQYFKDWWRDELIFDTLYFENSFFKENENISKLITNIIIDMLLQNIDDDFDKYIRNNEYFIKRMINVYLTSIRWLEDDYDSPKHIFVFDHYCMNEYVIPKLNLSKDLFV